MISKLLRNLERGFAVLKSNNHLLFVAILVFVFPILFIYITQNFFATAYTNIETSEKRRIGILHDSLSEIIKVAEVDQVQEAVASIAKENPDITEIRVLEKSKDELVIVATLDTDLANTIETKTDVFDTANVKPNSSFIFEFLVNETRIWQAARQVTISPEQTYFIFSEHSFATLDSIMVARRQQSYLGLTAIFMFLIALAHWFTRQIDWKRRYAALELQLNERDLFTQMIAHEFRAPLTVINGYISFLKESPAIHPAERRFVTNIEISAGRLLALVNDFLEVARIQSGKMTVELAETDIRDVIKSVVEANLLIANNKGLNLIFVPSQTPQTLVTDAARLHQVLQNMLSNSIKYTQKGSVEIEVEQNTVATIIRIKDTGMGITAEDQQKLFAPFSRVGGVDQSKISGTGLGMWITKQMIGLLHGAVSIESIKGVGTHVVITLQR
jgi:signal transduction histidine kinase